MITFAAAAVEPWLVDAAQRFAVCDDDYVCALNAGLVVRLWHHEKAQEAIQQARDWMQTCAADTARLTCLISDTTKASDDLAMLIRKLSGATLPPDDMFQWIWHRKRRTAVAHVVSLRDDLESVVAMLRLAGIAKELSARLRSIDAAAAALDLSLLLPELPLVGAGRWCAVAWQEPEAWWVRQPQLPPTAKELRDLIAIVEAELADLASGVTGEPEEVARVRSAALRTTLRRLRQCTVTLEVTS